MAISTAKELNQVLFEETGGVRKVILNRPKKLNSLTYGMICQMLKKLKQYENDPSANLLILKANGKAFCAGGDVTCLIGMMTFGHWSFGASHYRKLVTLDHLIGTYTKPLVALINGTVMGGGVGLSIHGRFRVVTEKTVFAMPEASIGMFPDVDASHFLSRLPGFLGEYLGLTGARLDGISMLACGLATHFVLSKDLASLENALDMASESSDSGFLTISKIINKFAEKLDLKQASIISRLDTINECFSGATVEEILSSLVGASATKEEKWIIDAVSSMQKASPTSLKVFLRSIKEGRAQNLDQCFIREFKIFCQVIRRELTDDFFEGSRAMLIDKDKNPSWVPSKLDQVNVEMVNKFFLDLDDEEWEPLKLPKRSNMSSYNLVSRI